ncbi:MAG: hypothetical protein KF819_06035 [Labilithrix sp.]|nr:hypothetical protein [Labilithrix sp.]
MDFLFGDLTPAPFATNVLEELRDAVEVAAAIADRDQVIVTADARREGLRSAANADRERVEQLVRSVLEAAQATAGPEGSPSASLATTLAVLVLERRAVTDGAIDEKLDADLRALEAETVDARADYFPILERYLLSRDPPGSVVTARVEIVATAKKKDERKYNAVLGGKWSGLAWSTELDVPDDGAWSEALRAGRLVEGLSVVAPYLAGLIKKDVKHKKQRLDRHVVTTLVDDGATLRAELRTEIGGSEGFDVVVTSDAKVLMAKVGDPEDASVGAFELETADAASMIDFASKLRAAARELSRRRLIAATLDEVPFDGNDPTSQPKLVELAARFVENVAPTIREIASRSRSETELVLRRLLDDGRREELFMPKARIQELVEPLDAEHQRLFASVIEALGVHGEARQPSQPDTLVRSEVRTSERPYVRRQSGGMAAVAAPPAPPVPPVPPVPPSDPVVEVLEVAEVAEVKEADPPQEAAPASKVDAMEALVATLKHIQSIAKDGHVDEAYRQYAALFASQPFLMCTHEDQRRALRLMFSGKGSPSPSEEAKAAYKASLPVLQALVLAQREAGDYEMLGMAYVGLDEPEKATGIYKKALEIERERDPGSDLCGTLMRRVSEL